MSTKHPMTLFLSTRQKKWFSVSCILILIFIVNNFVFPSQASAEATPGGNIHNAVVRAVDIDKPAVVRIITTLNGRLTVQFPNQASATFPLNGGKYKVDFSGSGAFISSHGDILTADHVIQPPHDDSTDMVLQSLAADDVTTYINQTFNPTVPYSSDEVYNSLISGAFTSTSQYDAPKSEVYLSTDYTGLINASTLTSVPQNMHAPIDKIEGSSPVNKNDVAIVHIQMDDTPSIRLGDSSNVFEQDNLTIIGFPGNGDLETTDEPDPTTYLTSSINQIYVSSIKQNSSSTLIQVGGNVEHGDSGGPALDSRGNIVGIVSFLSKDADTPVGTSFLQTSSSAKDLLDTLPSIDLKPGKFQTAWEQAFAQYASTSAGHWHKADSSFLAIQQKYPDFQVVAAFKDYTSEQAKNENLPQPSSQPIYPLLLLLAVIIIILALTWFLLSRRKKNRLSAAAAISAAQNQMYYAANTPPAQNFYNPYINPGNYPAPGNPVGNTNPGNYSVPGNPGSYPALGNAIGNTNPDTFHQTAGNETFIQQPPATAIEQAALPVDNQGITAETSNNKEEQMPTMVAVPESTPTPTAAVTPTPTAATLESAPTPTIETDFDASVPLIAPDSSKHVNPYAPQPISWQAFQELASHNPDTSHEPERYQRREEPMVYEPMSEEQTIVSRPEERTEPSQPTQGAEDVPFWSKPNQSTSEGRQDITDKHKKL